MKHKLIFMALAILLYGCYDIEPMTPKQIYKNQLIQSCNKGNTQYCIELAELIQKEDPNNAIQLYERACISGYVKACIEAGDIFSEGQLIKKSNKNAKHFYGLACDLGSQIGCREFKHY
ncbi:hypothetical protein [Campylobacter sp. MG1]|uniref:hypothetical protein n=1 Tax=Campylobacter sp. MG1 TaxID=2976332 RepID=UPI00226C845B|nr:hypothetical protein [Campylobacter sp. MG1]